MLIWLLEGTYANTNEPNWVVFLAEILYQLAGVSVDHEIRRCWFGQSRLSHMSGEVGFTQFDFDRSAEQFLLPELPSYVFSQLQHDSAQSLITAQVIAEGRFSADALHTTVNNDAPWVDAPGKVEEVRG